MITLESIQDQRFVCLGDFEVGEAAAVSEVKFRHNGLHGKTGQLRVHLDVYRLVGLHTNDKFVARNVLEDTGCHVAELNTDLSLLLIQG